MREDDYDFTILDEEVLEILDRAATKVAIKHPTSYLDRDDFYQEGALILARGARRVRQHLFDGNPGLVQTELERDLIDMVRTEESRASRHYSREALLEEWVE